ncbi:thioredoxin family protein [Fulvivirga sediminis]|uniref:Thioredoxin family protein n=1 Tax=Fulvivirga sediminis TaxID=2803949 RepID=A0A937FAI2_9BACT|nr:thioredoxin family protein [Fulvivirga sediminis]MBL3657997.1 thioredoxin family protein [Fulvivirga sediminis]
MSKFQELINGNKPVLVDFFSSIAGSGRSRDPLLNELKTEMGEKARIVRVNVDNNKHAAFTYGVNGVPTFILFKSGQVQWKHFGKTAKDEVSAILNQFV